jgi:hypothetical protein
MSWDNGSVSKVSLTKQDGDETSRCKSDPGPGISTCNGWYGWFDDSASVIADGELRWLLESAQRFLLLRTGQCLTVEIYADAKPTVSSALESDD